ncbi:MAG: DNA-3-methyladenine glycosylase I [Pseudomonadota bacterium]
MTKKRCEWCGDDPLYVAYHDQEWGVPVSDDQALFERLALEGMQAGLAWITVLKKRANMQQRFFNFDMQRLADTDQPTLDQWLLDPGIIRHAGKLSAMINNAQIALSMEDFAGFLWQFAPRRSPMYRRRQDVPAQTPESQAMSKALRDGGFKFVGPTICCAFMQSVGMVNDHVRSCWRFVPCRELRAQFMAGR